MKNTFCIQKQMGKVLLVWLIPVTFAVKARRRSAWDWLLKQSSHYSIALTSTLSTQRPRCWIDSLLRSSWTETKHWCCQVSTGESVLCVLEWAGTSFRDLETFLRTKAYKCDQLTPRAPAICMSLDHCSKVSDKVNVFMCGRVECAVLIIIISLQWVPLLNLFNLFNDHLRIFYFFKLLLHSESLFNSVYLH